MATSGTVRPQLQAWAVPDDKRYPSVRWFASGSVAGDISGGDTTVNVIWSNDSPNALFSVEGITLALTGISANTNYIGAISTNHLVTGSTFYAINYSGTLVGIAAGLNEVRNLVVLERTPIFLPQRSGVNWQVAASVANPGAGNSLVIDCWGYIWDIDALKFIGGPLRPGDFVPIG